MTACRHPMRERTHIVEQVLGSFPQTFMVQWCGRCGGLKTGDGPWWKPGGSLRPRVKTRRVSKYVRSNPKGRKP